MSKRKRGKNDNANTNAAYVQAEIKIVEKSPAEAIQELNGLIARYYSKYKDVRIIDIQLSGSSGKLSLSLGDKIVPDRRSK